MEEDDDAAFWRAHREARQAKRASNRQQSAEILKAAGVQFYTANGGDHLQIGDPVIADFWPGTGLWVFRGSGSRDRGRGVKRLIKKLKSKE